MIKIGTSWVLFGAGHVWSKIAVERGIGHLWEWPYRAYSRLMESSNRLQGDDPRGPWGPAETEE